MSNDILIEWWKKWKREKKEKVYLKKKSSDNIRDIENGWLRWTSERVSEKEGDKGKIKVEEREKDWESSETAKWGRNDKAAIKQRKGTNEQEGTKWQPSEPASERERESERDTNHQLWWEKCKRVMKSNIWVSWK